MYLDLSSVVTVDRTRIMGHPVSSSVNISCTTAGQARIMGRPFSSELSCITAREEGEK